MFQMFQLIADIETSTYVAVADVLLTVVMAAVQAVLVVSFAPDRRATTNRHLIEKPGRQTLEVLRIANLALWGLGTFVFKHPATQESNSEVSSVC